MLSSSARVCARDGAKLFSGDHFALHWSQSLGISGHRRGPEKRLVVGCFFLFFGDLEGVGGSLLRLFFWGGSAGFRVFYLSLGHGAFFRFCLCCFG